MPRLKTFRSMSGSQLVLWSKLINIIISRIHICWYWHNLIYWEIQAYKELFISIWSLWDYTGKEERGHVMFLLLPSFWASVFNFQLLSWLEISFPYGCLTSDGNAEALCPHKTWPWISYNPIRKTKVTPGIWWGITHGNILLRICNKEKVAKKSAKKPGHGRDELFSLHIVASVENSLHVWAELFSSYTEEWEKEEKVQGGLSHLRTQLVSPKGHDRADSWPKNK